MADDTTITVRESTHERLAAYRAAGHNSFSDLLDGMMDMLPTREQLGQGCANVGCDDAPADRATPADGNGVIKWFRVGEEFGGGSEVMYYCSVDCAINHQHWIDERNPAKDPDHALVGGHEQLRATISAPTVYIEAEGRTEVGVDVPGAFTGTDSHGDCEYDYEGEPVYIVKNGRVVLSGVVDEVINEESHTALVVDQKSGMDVIRECHPDEDKRPDDDAEAADAKA